MRFVFPQERLDRLRNSGNQKSALTKKQKWSFIFFMLNSTALYQICIMTTRYYLNDDRLALSYHFRVGIATSILALIIEFLAKNKSHKFKIWLATLIMVGMVMSALLIPLS